MEPTGRMFLRDIGDLNLHNPVVFALNSAVATNADLTQLQNATLRFEYANPYHYHTLPEDTANGKESMVGRYPPNTQFHWALFAVQAVGRTGNTPGEEAQRHMGTGSQRRLHGVSEPVAERELRHRCAEYGWRVAEQRRRPAAVAAGRAAGGAPCPGHATWRLSRWTPTDDPNNTDADLEKLERLLEIRQVTWLHAQLASPAILTKIKNYHATLC